MEAIVPFLSYVIFTSLIQENIQLLIFSHIRRVPWRQTLLVFLGKLRSSMWVETELALWGGVPEEAKGSTCSCLSCQIPALLCFCTGVQFLGDCLPIWSIIIKFLALILCRNPRVWCQTASAEVLVLAGNHRVAWIWKNPFYIQLHFVHPGCIHQYISPGP